MPLPLDKVRVLDLTNVVAGPLASYQLVMLGAEVIKIEVPGVGDLARKMGADPSLGQKQMGASFLALNAGKKSLTLNLKDARGKEIFKRLVRHADVVLENFRPGAMKKLGLDYPVLKDINPGLVYCAVSGFGQEGPLAQRPSYDQIIQGFCGLMSITGDENTGPTRAGYIVCDTMAAITAAFAVCASLYRREKTGEGEMIDVSMLDASLASMASWPISNYLNARKVPVPMGNESHTASPSGTFRTGKGLLNIVNNEQKQWESLCKVIGRPEWTTDPRFADRYTRIARRAELRALLEEVLQAKSAEEWEQLFNEAGVPAGPILNLPDIVQHPQIRSRELIKRFKDAPGVGRDVAVSRLGFRLSKEQPDVDQPPPTLGRDTDEILKAAGYSGKDIEAFRSAGVI
ncbi:MAG TPA: CoA transferase [Burkholderiales bacterium]|nr:CoA transferase [Burkholderiales bacterium]